MTISHTGQQIFESITSNAEELPGGGYGQTNMFKIGFCHRVAEDAD